MTADDWMDLAIAEARGADEGGDVPIGCVIVDHVRGFVVGRGRNRREVDSDPTGHAEVVALREAGRTLGSWRLTDCTMVVTLEPCPMCAGAAVNARIGRIVYGCADPKAGAVTTLFRLADDPRLNHRIEVVAGVKTEQCADLLRRFFRRQRAMGKK